MHKIAIHSVPRSGSTWLGNIINSHPDVIFKFQPLFSYTFKGRLSESSSKTEVNKFFEEITFSDDEFINQKNAIKENLIPSFKKSKTPSVICYKEVRYHNILENLLRITDDIKFVFLIRNPLATLYSWKNAPSEFKEDLGWVFENEWLDAPKKNLNRDEEFNGYNKWKEAVSIFVSLKNKYPEKVFILKYSDLLKNTRDQVENLFSFLQLSWDDQVENYLSQMKKRNDSNAYSVYKIKEHDNEWTSMSKEIIDYIHNDLKDTELKQFLS